MKDDIERAGAYSLVEKDAGTGQYRVINTDQDSPTMRSQYAINDEGELIDLNLLAARIHDWRERKGFDTGDQNIPEKLMLMVTELAEVMEDYRKPGLLANEIYYEPKPDGSMKPCGVPVELADCIIRILDLSSALNTDIAYALALKMDYNETRPHKHGKTC